MLRETEWQRLLGRQWLSHMRAGDFAAAWTINDEVIRRGWYRPSANLPRHYQVVWNGETLAGKAVRIVCHHGLGDTIQFVRYAPRVKEIAGSVTLCAQPQLLPLLRTMERSFDELLPLDDRRCDLHAAQVCVEVMELPHIFRTTLRSVPADVPYFRVRPARLPDRRRPNVGLVWEGSLWDPQRSIPFEFIRALAASADVNWHVIQRGEALNDWNEAFGRNSGAENVLEAAGVIAALDLLITIDSMPAHLAGALGVPTWILLAADPDWRWMTQTAASPWYPTARLFRQTQQGEWWPVIEAVTAALQDLRDINPVVHA